MTHPTPTQSDEALKQTPQHELPKWRYSINYGPDGEDNYAFVYDSMNVCVGNLKTYHAMEVVEAMNRPAALAAERRKVETFWKALKSYHQPQDADKGWLGGQNAVVEAMFGRLHPQGLDALAALQDEQQGETA